MAAYNLGKILPTPKGDYDNLTTYEFLDVVVYQGSSYLARTTTVGNAPFPEDTTYWQLLAIGGESIDISGKADKDVTPTVITPSVDGTVANLTAEELESLRVGDIIKAVTTGTSIEWVVVRVKTSTPREVAMVQVSENGIATRLWIKQNGSWIGNDGASIQYENVAKKISTSTAQPQNGMVSNTLYNFDVLSQSTIFSINNVQEGGIANVWMWTFKTGSVVPQLTFPAVAWFKSADTETVGNVVVPVVEQSKYYEVSVMNGFGIIVGADIQ